MELEQPQQKLYLSDKEIKTRFKKMKLHELPSPINIYGGNFTKRYDDMIADKSLITKSNLVILELLDLMYNVDTIISTYGYVLDEAGITAKRFAMYSLVDVLELCSSKGIIISPSLRTLFMFQYAIDNNHITEKLVPKHIKTLLSLDEIKDGLSTMTIGVNS